jgi:hypothetical protein
MIAQVFADPQVNFVLFLLILLPVVQFVTGVLRAVSAGQFQLGLLDVYVRTDIAGRVLPLLILIVTGRIVEIAAPDALNIPGLDIGIFTGAGIGFAVVYLVVVIRNILGNVNPAEPDALPVE